MIRFKLINRYTILKQDQGENYAAKEIFSSGVAQERERKALSSAKLPENARRPVLPKLAASSSIAVISFIAASGEICPRRTDLLISSMQPLRAGRDEGSMVVFRIRLHFSVAGSEES